MHATVNRSSAPSTPGAHDCDNGFCSVCGMVWPCSWARRHPVPAALTLPISRLPTRWS